MPDEQRGAPEPGPRASEPLRPRADSSPTRRALEARRTAESLPGLASPDVWSRRWVRVGVVLCLFAFLCPSVGERPESGAGFIAFWEVPEMLRVSWFSVLTPLLLVLVGLMALRRTGASRGLLVFVGALGLSVADVLLTRDGSPASDPANVGTSEFVVVLLGVAGVLGVIAIAVGNHLRRRAPAAALPSTLAGVGGILVVLVFFFPVDGGPALRVFFDPEWWRGWWPALLFFATCFVYGVLGLWAFASSNVAGRCRTTGLVGRTILFGHPLLFLSRGMMEGVVPGLIIAKGVAATAGPLILVVTGLAAWIEGAWVARNRPPLDPEAAADVFA